MGSEAIRVALGGLAGRRLGAIQLEPRDSLYDGRWRVRFPEGELEIPLAGVVGESIADGGGVAIQAGFKRTLVFDLDQRAAVRAVTEELYRLLGAHHAERVLARCAGQAKRTRRRPRKTAR